MPAANEREQEQASYRRVLKSSSLIGAATAITIIIGLGRMKLLALMLGATGFGLLGLLNVLLATATALVGFGLHASGVARLADGSSSADEGRTAGWALWSLTLILGLLGMLAMVVFQEPISRIVTGSSRYSGEVALLGVAVAFSNIAATQLIFFQARREMRVLAEVRVYGAIVATLLAVAAVYLWGVSGIVVSVAAVPLAGVLVALACNRRPMAPLRPVPRLAEIQPHWRAFIGFGFIFVIAAVLNWTSQLAARAAMTQEYGLEAAGLYQAVFSLSAANVGLVLAAMSADYFPRLVAAGPEPSAAARIVDQQVKVSLLLGAPILLALIALAPIALQILYSSEFVAAAQMLRWQVAGDVLKLFVWALGFALIARGANMLYLGSELLFAGSFYLAALVLPSLGLGVDGYGAAWLVSNAASGTYLLVVSRRTYGLQLSSGTIRIGAALATLALTLVVLGHFSPAAAIVGGALAATGVGVISARTLMRDVGLQRGFIKLAVARLSGKH